MVSASNTDSFLEVSQISLFTAGLYYCNIAHVKNPLTVWNQRRIGDFPSCLGKVNGYAPLLTEGKHWHITHQEMFIPRQGDPKLPLRINECRYIHSIRGKNIALSVLCVVSLVSLVCWALSTPFVCQFYTGTLGLILFQTATHMKTAFETADWP